MLLKPSQPMNGHGFFGGPWKSRSIWWAVVFAVGVAAGRMAVPEAAASERIDPARIAEFERLLPPASHGVGPTIDDREAWEAAAKAPGFEQVVERARQLLQEPIPELPDELFLDFSRTGNRSRCERVLSRRHRRVGQLVVAECIENQGRFLPAIEEAIRAVCSEKTWVLPAHDRGLRNFRGATEEIDLAVAGLSWNLATADYWLGNRLNGEVRALLRQQLQRRTFGPFLRLVTTGRPPMWWLTGTNNWNAVCLAGVTGSALAVIDSPQRRALFAAAAERYIEHFLSGFTPDGYCSEGLGYWNYGFGHYVMLAETLHQATGGKVDLLDGDLVRRVAMFGRRMEVSPGIYPAFADCSVGTKPDPRLMAFLSRRYQWGLKEVEETGLLLAAGPSSQLFALGLFGFENSATAVPPRATPPPSPPLREWFPDAGILIARPAGEVPRGLAVALKGGHNAEHHNHNDVGSFLVAVGGEVPLVDPGAEVYTARTFSSRRYESGVLNSFGHAVPMVGGKLQRSGRAAAAKILQTEFTDAVDTIALDLRAAYDVPSLKKLTRTFVLARAGGGSLTVTDAVEFDSPQQFGVALITFSQWTRCRPDCLEIGSGKGAVRVEVATGGLPLEIHDQPIREDVRGGHVPVRLGIDLSQPVAEAVVVLQIEPVP